MAETRRIKNIDDLTFGDEYIFEEVMQNKDLCKSFIETFLEIPDVVDIEYINSEESYKDSFWAKGVRFDIFVKGHDGVAYVVELQQTDTKEIDKRIRYYQSMIDSMQLPKGKMSTYKDLKDSFIIFIVRADLFNRGRYRYTFQTVCLEEPNLILDNGARIVVFNTRGTHGDVSEDVKEFLKAIEGNTINGMKSSNLFVQKFEKFAEQIKANESWRKAYMQTELRIQDKIEAGIEAGIEAAVEAAVEVAVEAAVEAAVEVAVEAAVEEAVKAEVEKERITMAKSLLSANMSVEDVAKHSGLSSDAIEKLRLELS